jgi:hypothetical protein
VVIQSVIPRFPLVFEVLMRLRLTGFLRKLAVLKLFIIISAS